MLTTETFCSKLSLCNLSCFLISRRIPNSVVANVWDFCNSLTSFFINKFRLNLLRYMRNRFMNGKREWNSWNIHWDDLIQHYIEMVAGIYGLKGGILRENVVPQEINWISRSWRWKKHETNDFYREIYATSEGNEEKRKKLMNAHRKEEKRN